MGECETHSADVLEAKCIGLAGFEWIWVRNDIGICTRIRETYVQHTLSTVHVSNDAIFLA